MFIYIRFPYVANMCMCIYSILGTFIIGPATPGPPSDHIMRSYSIHLPYFTLTGVNAPWAPVWCQRDLVLSSTDENSFDLGNGAQVTPAW